MAKLEECKTCGKEVAKNAKVCPHCGQKNPTVKTRDVILGFVVISIVIAIFMSFGDDDVSRANSKVINKQDYGEKWAFTTDTAILKCYNDDGIESPVIILDGKQFGLTGFADSMHGQNNINAINKYWLRNEKLGINKDLGIFTEEALELCKK